MDVHVNRAITVALRRRGVDVVTAQEDGGSTFTDPVLLDRATALQRVLFTQDVDLLAEASTRQKTGSNFAGVLYSRQGIMSVGQHIDELELIAKALEPAEMMCRVVWMPLR